MLLKMLHVVIFVLLCGGVLGKECTNIPTQPTSHTLRYALLNSHNKTSKDEVNMLSHVHDHATHLTPTDDSAWASLMPRKVLKQEDEVGWMMMYKQMKNQGVVSKFNGSFLNEISLNDVRLDPDSIHGQAQQTNLEYLLMLDSDSLVWSFRKTAGLPTPGAAYGGWEGPDQELRGHFVGHYLSATAQMWASTGNDTLKQKMIALVSALGECQTSDGYLSAFPSEFFDRVEAIKPVWAPYYTIHKIMAGLLDQYVLAGNDQALKMVTQMADYFNNRVQNVIKQYTIERHWQSLNEEFGGMNDVLYRLYTITGNNNYLVLAHLFDKPCFLGLLATKADALSGFHANAHIPIVVGAEMRYEVTGDPVFKDISTFFMDTVTSSHMYATGGTSVNEFWSEPKQLATTLQTENEESCTTYNMLKVSRNLFRWTKEIAYADYYERALTNGVLSIQRGKEPGIMIYMLPLGAGSSKAISLHEWGTQFESFWCCYGSGIESFSKLGDSIYFEEAGNNPALYIIQYISNSLNWKLGQMSLEQKVAPVVSWDPYLRVNITISSKKEGISSTLNFRIPFWTTTNAKATLNGHDIPLNATGNFLSVTNKWSLSDVITLELPITLRTEAIEDERSEYASLQAILFGPYLLVGMSMEAADLKPGSGSLSDWITPIPSDYNSQLISLSQQTGNTTLALTLTSNYLTTIPYPDSGTNSSVFSTFRIIPVDPKTPIASHDDIINKTVMLEPYSLPGMVIIEQGKEESLGTSNMSDSTNAVFRFVDGNEGMLRLESESQKGCFVYSFNGTVKLSCDSGGSDSGFMAATSFKVNDGISSYHPISFVAKGLNMNYLLQPLFSLRDEHYTVYFNLQ